MSKTGWTITSAATTDIYVYFGNAGAADGNDPTNVWDGNFLAVYHMMDKTTSTIEDATGNQPDGTKTAANEPVEADGKLYKCQSFDNNNDRINIGDFEPTQNNAYITCWVKCPTASPAEQEPVINKGFTSHTSPYYEIYLFLKTSQVSGGFTVGGNPKGGNAAIDITDNAWHYLALRYDGDVGKEVDIGYDGGNWVQVYNGGLTGNISNYATDMYIGGYTNLSLVGDAYYFDGFIEEVRISDITRSDDWNNFEYMNMNEADNELAWGVLESSVDAGRSMFFGSNF